MMAEWILTGIAVALMIGSAAAALFMSWWEYRGRYRWRVGGRIRMMVPRRLFLEARQMFPEAEISVYDTPPTGPTGREEAADGHGQS